MAGFINLLEASNPSVTSPFSVIALHLIELLGRAAPMFIDHDVQEVPSQYAAFETIHNALQLYQVMLNYRLLIMTSDFDTILTLII